jgi:hypothetical protein
MTEYSFDSQTAESITEFVSGSLAPEIRRPVQSVPMPFELESREAEALRGAISFLFALITSYDELLAADAAASEGGASPDGDPH